MNISLVLENLITAPILFFLLGMAATLLRSDLSVPTPVARFVSLYLLFSIGLHGGVEFSQSGMSREVVLVILAAILLAVAVPTWSFFLLKRKIAVVDAAAIAAAYGSISAVTFVTAASFLQGQGETYGGYMIACMAIMESPAIIVGVFLGKRFGAHIDEPEANENFWTHLLREAFLNGAVFLLLGSLVIGWLVGEEGWKDIKAFAYDPFKGVLCLFLLDMGLIAARRLRDLKQSGLFLVAFGALSAPVHAALGIVIAHGIGLQAPDALLLAVLAGSASYIAVPAAVQIALPEANPSLYLPLALAVTFPFNVAIGIPLYWMVIQWGWGL